MLDILQVLIHFVVGSLLIVTGVNTMGSTLEQANSKLLDKAMRAFSRNKWTSFFTGILLTGLVQSSTAVTILTIGFVDSGIMKLESAVGIIYGANIGTTFTAQFMSFQITQYSRYILIAGCILSFGPMRKFRTAGNVLAGIGLLFSGLELMDKSVNILKNNAFLVQWLQAHSDNVFLCLLAGLVITMLVQSSSATVGMTILLFNGGLLPLSSAVALTLGDNIGSCIVAQIAGMESSTAGKRTAWAHTIYNIAGVLLVWLFLPQFCRLVQYMTHWMGQDGSRLIANAHMIFNVLSAMLFLPISKYYVRFLQCVIPERKPIRRLKESRHL